MNETAASMRSEINELRGLLEKHQWSGLTPAGSVGCCPECAGVAPPLGAGHHPGCAIGSALAAGNDPARRS
jgi:hypothetical protein